MTRIILIPHTKYSNYPQMTRIYPEYSCIPIFYLSVFTVLVFPGQKPTLGNRPTKNAGKVSHVFLYSVRQSDRAIRSPELPLSLALISYEPGHLLSKYLVRSLHP